MAKYNKPGHYIGSRYLGRIGSPDALIGDRIVGAVFERSKPARWMSDAEYASFTMEQPKRELALLRSLKRLVAAITTGAGTGET
jgi:hypothetical protein